jgi:sugar phosphate isomerase/epimerase
MSLRISFSTLACPDWTMPQIIAIAAGGDYNGIELRFVQGEDSLWKLPVFSGKELVSTKRALADRALTISCLDTSCRFHSPDAAERRRWITEGQRMADLAAELGASGLRVLVTRSSRERTAPLPKLDRESVGNWRNCCSESGVWLGTMVTLRRPIRPQQSSGGLSGRGGLGPGEQFRNHREQPARCALGEMIRHVHIKDLQRDQDGWRYVLTGKGVFPLLELKATLEDLHYERFLSFEWEKKWHPEIADADIALPHFARWFRKNYA